MPDDALKSLLKRRNSIKKIEQVQVGVSPSFSMGRMHGMTGTEGVKLNGTSLEGVRDSRAYSKTAESRLRSARCNGIPGFGKSSTPRRCTTPRRYVLTPLPTTDDADLGCFCNMEVAKNILSGRYCACSK